MSPPENLTRSPTHDEVAADVVDSATAADPLPMPARRVLTRVFWWLAHHIVARPLVAALPFRPVFRFSAWTLDRCNM